MKTIIVTLVCIVATVTASPQIYPSQNPQPSVGFAPTRLFFDFANRIFTPFNTLTSSFIQNGQATADAVDQTVWNGGLLSRLSAFNPISPVSAATNNFIRQSNNAASQFLQTGQDLAANAVNGIPNVAAGIGNQMPQATANAAQQTANGYGSANSSNARDSNTGTQVQPTTAGAMANANPTTKNSTPN